MRKIAVVQGLLTLVAFIALILLFARTDLSVKLVFDNSHSAKPMIYKLAGAWGNHEGSMLLWVTVLAVVGRLPWRLLAARSRADADRRARRPGRARARLLRLPAVRLEPVRAAVPDAGRGAGPQSLAPGPRPRLPPADALPRLCRPVGRVQPRGRRAAGRRRRLAPRPRDAAVGARRLGVPHARASPPAAIGPITSSAGAAGGSGTRSRTPR